MADGDGGAGTTGDGFGAGQIAPDGFQLRLVVQKNIADRGGDA